MRLVGMSVVSARPGEHGRAVRALRLLVLVGVDEGTVKLDGLHAREVPPAFRAAVPLFYELLPKEKDKKCSY